MTDVLGVDTGRTVNTAAVARALRWVTVRLFSGLVVAATPLMMILGPWANRTQGTAHTTEHRTDQHSYIASRCHPRGFLMIMMIFMVDTRIV